MNVVTPNTPSTSSGSEATAAAAPDAATTTIGPRGFPISPIDRPAYKADGKLIQRNTSSLMQWIVVLVIVVFAVVAFFPLAVPLGAVTQETYNCDETVGQCTIATGTQGAYSTLSDCSAQCNATPQWTCGVQTVPGSTPNSYLHVNMGQCVQTRGSGPGFYPTQAECATHTDPTSGSCCVAQSFTCDPTNGCQETSSGSNPQFTNHPCNQDFSGSNTCLAQCVQRFQCTDSGCQDMGFSTDTTYSAGTCATNGNTCPSNTLYVCGELPSGGGQYGCVAAAPGQNGTSCQDALANCGSNCTTPCGTVCCPAGYRCCTSGESQTCVPEGGCWTINESTCQATYNCGVNDECGGCQENPNGTWGCSGSTCEECDTCIPLGNNQYRCGRPPNCVDCAPVQPKPPSGCKAWYCVGQPVPTCPNTGTANPREDFLRAGQQVPMEVNVDHRPIQKRS